MGIQKKNALYRILSRINACEFSDSNKVVFTYLNCFTLKSSVGGICGRELGIIGPFKGAAILLQRSVYDISKYHIAERALLRRFDCLSSWREEFSTGLSRLRPDPEDILGEGVGEKRRGATGPPSSTRTINSSSRPGAGAAGAGTRGRLGLLGTPGAGARSFGRSLRAGSFALLHREPRRA